MYRFYVVTRYLLCVYIKGYACTTYLRASYNKNIYDTIITIAMGFHHRRILWIVALQQLYKLYRLYSTTHRELGIYCHSVKTLMPVSQMTMMKIYMLVCIAALLIVTISGLAVDSEKELDVTEHQIQKVRSANSGANYKWSCNIVSFITNGMIPYRELRNLTKLAKVQMRMNSIKILKIQEGCGDVRTDSGSFTGTYVQVYTKWIKISVISHMILCGMLRGRLQRKNSAHIRDVCTLLWCRQTSFDVALWIIDYFIIKHLLIIAHATYLIIALLPLVWPATTIQSTHSFKKEDGRSRPD